jgi:hypothetical protein
VPQSLLRNPVSVCAAALAASVLLADCALRNARFQDYGIPPCEKGTESDLLSAAALQCWFSATNGRWRTLGHQSHLEALVVDVEARQARDDAHEIARRFVESTFASAYSEILVYVRPDPSSRSNSVRRVRWTTSGTFETLDFASADSDSPLAVQSAVGGR